MAKDVTNFLSWAAEPEHDERKKIGIKAVILFSALTALSLYVKRFKWNVIKNRKIGESRNVMLIADRGLTECALVYNPPVDKTH
jgi:ubiquinol-cytochrome c reductase cytochrome c1 subunit